MIRKILIIIGLICFFSFSYSQDEVKLAKLEDSLCNLSNTMLHAETDFEKYAANTAFKKTLEEALSMHKSYKYPFDSLNMIARLYSDDNKFRLFNWHIARQEGSYEYFGIVQSYNKKKKEYRTYELIDKSEEIESPEEEMLQRDEWYGAHYYKLIETKYKKRKYYTLLGWDGASQLTTRKIIEVVRLSSSGRPRFGAYLFRDRYQTKKRVLFEFSANASMSLKYDEQMLDPEKLYKKNTRSFKKMSFISKFLRKWKYKRTHKKLVGKKRKRDIKRRKRLESKQERRKSRWRRTKKTKRFVPEGVENNDIKKEKMEMIVFDRIVPEDPILEGLYQFYAPNASAYDAYVFYDGKWRFVEDIEARNWDMTSPSKKQTPVSLDLYPAEENDNK